MVCLEDMYIKLVTCFVYNVTTFCLNVLRSEMRALAQRFCDVAWISHNDFRVSSSLRGLQTLIDCWRVLVALVRESTGY